MQIKSDLCSVRTMKITFGGFVISSEDFCNELWNVLLFGMIKSSKLSIVPPQEMISDLISTSLNLTPCCLVLTMQKLVPRKNCLKPYVMK